MNVIDFECDTPTREAVEDIGDAVNRGGARSRSFRRRTPPDLSEPSTPGGKPGLEEQREGVRLMGFAYEAPVLDGTRVRLEPLEHRHAPDLAAAAEEDRGAYRFTWVPGAHEVEA